MTLYTCERCKKNFNRKNEYENHLNRLYPCQTDKVISKQKIEYSCNICNKKYVRLDTLRRHFETKTHKNNDKNQKININTGDMTNITNKNSNNGIVNNNNGNVVINKNNKNYYFISPFGQEEISKLTSLEKMATLLSQENPIIEIILITNLNPHKPEYHNIGYTDLKSGYGVMFNGKTWERKEVNAMINELLMLKKNDLFKIRLEISPYLSKEHKKIIEEKLQNVRDNVEPRLEHHVKSKKKLIKNLKTHLVNNRSIVQEAIIKSGAPIEGIKNDNSSSWMNEYNFDDIDKKIEKVKSKKDSVRNMLKYINHLDHETMIKIIDTAQNLNEISVINRLLIRSMIDKNDINEETIKQQIKKDDKLNEIIFGKK